MIYTPIIMSVSVAQSHQASVPRKEVCRESPLQKRGWTRSIFLGREELKAVDGINVIELRRNMRAADDHEATVEDADGGRVPAALQKVQSLQIFEERAAFAYTRDTRLEDADSLVSSRVYGRVSREDARVAPDADLQCCYISIASQ